MRVTMKYNSAPTSCETFSYGEVEDYTVILTGNAASARNNYIDATEIGNEDPTKVVIYPNPTGNSTVSVICNDDIVFMNNIVKIFNSNGSLVKITNVNEGGQIDVSDLPAGLYIITIDDPKEPFVTKFVKE